MLLASIIWAQNLSTPQKNQKALLTFLNTPGFQSASISFVAMDLQSQEIICSHSPHKVLKPASSLKLLSTASALELLGPDFKFKTQLLYNGKIEAQTQELKGNIIIKGYGDPSLGSSHFRTTNDDDFFSHCILALKKTGISSISGRIIGDARYYSSESIPETWTWESMGNYYGAGPNGLSIFDNTYKLYFRTGAKVGQASKITGISPNIPNLSFNNKVKSAAISYDNAYLYASPYSNNIEIRGELPLNKSKFAIKGSIPDPAYLCAYTLDSLLKQSSISIKNNPSTFRLMPSLAQGKQTHIIYTHYSPSLKEIIKKTNTHSINLFAELCLIEAGIALKAQPKTKNAADSVLSYWKKRQMPTQGLRIYDGSGMSHYNSISASQLVFLLNYMRNESNYYQSFYESLAIAGKTGTLKYFLQNKKTEGKIHAKSGTIDFGKSYAGYIKTVSGKEIAFAIIVNNYSCSKKEATQKIAQLIEKLTLNN